MKEIKNKTTRIIHLGKSVLLPGLNSVSQADYDLYKGAIDEKVKSGDFEDLSCDEECDFAEGLMKYDEKKAIALAETCNDFKTLEEWKLTETRKRVVAAINGQLKALNVIIEDAKKEGKKKKKEEE